jgi:TfoX/Sxy family transcriptional regulator of competence genes
MTMPYYEVPAEVLDDPGAFLEWAGAAIAAGHATAKAKKPARRK